MLNWTANAIRLDLKYTWKLSRNATDYKINTIIEVTDGTFMGKGEVAPNIRYDETPERIAEEFNRFANLQAEHIKSLDDLNAILLQLKPCNALRFGIESAYVHFICAKNNTTVTQFLDIEKPQALPTSFSLPIMPHEDIAAFFTQHNLGRFKRIKVKVNADEAHNLLSAVTQATKVPLIVDANEGWKDADALIRFLETLKQYPIDIIEQPMPSAMKDEYKLVKKHCPFPLIADESVCEDADFDELKQQFHGINMKLMKAGGYINGLGLLNEARKHKMHTMVGCMIETTLGISSAMQLCHNVETVDLDGFLIIKNEPFELVSERNGELVF